MRNPTYSDKGSNFTDILKSNTSLIVKLLMQNKRCTRSELARISGLSQAAVTKITGSLIELQIIEEVGLGKGERGRRTIELQLTSSKYFLIGVKISRKSFSAGVFDLLGEMYSSQTQEIKDEHTPEYVLSQIAQIIENYLRANPDIIAAGISVPGPYLRNTGKIAKMTEFAGWEHHNLVDYFARHAPIPVFIEHDANAGALAEWWFGNTTSQVLIHIIASEGIGSGIINNGQLFYGVDGIAGEIGHMSIAYDGRRCQCSSESRGCLEQYCSALSFMRDVRAGLAAHPESVLHRISPLAVDDVFDAAKENDAYAIAMIRQAGFYLGVGLTNVVNIYNPDTIVISDIMTRAGELLLTSIRETLKARILPELYDNLSIQISKLQYDSSLYGAAAVAVDKFLEHPGRFTASAAE